jgi:glutathione synthase/RimK-type ligase-like ATP-grasp enzyme
MSKILVITSRDDAHADHVINVCNGRGLSDSIVRFNTEDFVNNCVVTFDGEQFSLRFRDSGRNIESQQITAVWYRRPAELLISGENDPGIVEWIRKQSTACLRGIYFCCHDSALWVNPLPALHRARHKLQQLKIAKAIGFHVPRTCVTNDPEKAREFSASTTSRLCTKSLDEPNYKIDGHLFPFLTRVLAGSEEIEKNASSIERCPVLLQEYVEKRADIRVVGIGPEIFAVEIASQDNHLSSHDFRGIAPALLKHTQHTLPSVLIEKIRTFMATQALMFSAIDLAWGVDGEYYFLENNPNGQWLWLEHGTDIPLTEAMLRLLFGERDSHN